MHCQGNHAISHSSNGFIFRAIFPHLSGLQKHTLEVLLTVQGWSNWTQGYSGMCILSHFIDTKSTIYFGMDIMIYSF